MSVSSCTNPGISKPVAKLIQPKFMVPLDLHVNDKMYNSTSLNGTCFVELKIATKAFKVINFKFSFALTSLRSYVIQVTCVLIKTETRQ